MKDKKAIGTLAFANHLIDNNRPDAARALVARYRTAGLQHGKRTLAARAWEIVDARLQVADGQVNATIEAILERIRDNPKDQLFVRFYKKVRNEQGLETIHNDPAFETLVRDPGLPDSLKPETAYRLFSFLKTQRAAVIVTPEKAEEGVSVYTFVAAVNERLKRKVTLAGPEGLADRRFARKRIGLLIFGPVADHAQLLRDALARSPRPLWICLVDNQPLDRKHRAVVEAEALYENATFRRTSLVLD